MRQIKKQQEHVTEQPKSNPILECNFELLATQGFREAQNVAHNIALRWHVLSNTISAKFA